MDISPKIEIAELQARLQAIGVDVPRSTLSRWGYDKREIIPRPTRFKRGTGSKKSGPAAWWDEQAVYEAAAVYAVLHSSRTIGHPPLSIIPHIKSAARQPYESPTAGYNITQISSDVKNKKEATYKSIEVSFGFPTSLGKEPAEWQVLLTTWIAAIEKAKRGIRIDTPQQIRFHWESVKVKKGVDYEPKKVNDFDEDNHISLHESESGHDEIVIMIDGVDERETISKMLYGRFTVAPDG
jgi:hypothetical protein